MPATSTDLFTWTKHGPMFPDFNTFLPQGNGMDGPWSKAGAILPVPIDGRYLMYFGEGSIWYAWSGGPRSTGRRAPTTSRS